MPDQANPYNEESPELREAWAEGNRAKGRVLPEGQTHNDPDAAEA